MVPRHPTAFRTFRAVWARLARAGSPCYTEGEGRPQMTQFTMKVQTGTRYDWRKVGHHAAQAADGTIITACGAGATKQTYYILTGDECAGYCARCLKAGQSIWA